MAIEEHDLEQVKPGSKVGRPPLYPWEEWMDGEIHYLEVDPDDAAAIKRKRASLHQKARENGKRVITRMTLEGQLAFQFKEKTDGEDSED